MLPTAVLQEINGDILGDLMSMVAETLVHFLVMEWVLTEDLIVLFSKLLL